MHAHMSKVSVRSCPHPDMHTYGHTHIRTNMPESVCLVARNPAGLKMAVSDVDRDPLRILREMAWTERFQFGGSRTVFVSSRRSGGPPAGIPPGEHKPPQDPLAAKTPAAQGIILGNPKQLLVSPNLGPCWIQFYMFVIIKPIKNDHF